MLHHTHNLLAAKTILLLFLDLDAVDSTFARGISVERER